MAATNYPLTGIGHILATYFFISILSQFPGMWYTTSMYKFNPDSISPFVSDFWAHVRIGTADECWPWLGHKNPKGIGVYTFRSRMTTAAQFAWHAAGMPRLPAKKNIKHTCGNCNCCNPAHFYIAGWEPEEK